MRMRFPRGRAALLGCALLSGLFAASVRGQVTPPPSGDVLVSPSGVTVTPSGLLPDLVKILEGDTVKHLFDTDAATLYTAYGQSKVKVTFPAARAVSSLKVLGASSYTLSVKAVVNGQMTPVAGLGSVNLATLGPGWHTLAATQPVTTAELELTLDPQALLGLIGSTGIAEFEVWGTGTHVNATAANAASANPPPQAVTVPSAAALPPEGVEITGAAATARIDFTVPYAPANIRRAFLVYELSGLSHWSEASRSINGAGALGGHVRQETATWSTQTEPLAPAQLLKGANAVEFRAIAGGSYPYRVRNVRLVVEPFDGWNALDRIEANQSGGALVADGDLATAWSIYPANTADRAPEPTLAAELSRAIALDRLRLHVTAPVSGVFFVEARSAETWASIGQAREASTLAPGWNTISLGGAVAATAVRLRFVGGDGAGAVSEFEVAGSVSGALDANPTLTISYPDAGQYFGDTAYIRGALRPDRSASGPANIVVAGRPAVVDKGTFEIAISKSDLGITAAGDWSVTVDAVYPEGRHVSRTVTLTQNIDAIRNDTGTGAATSLVSDLLGGVAKTLTLAGAVLDIGADALTTTTRIVMQTLRDVDMARPDPGLVNVTKTVSGYRFLPHDQRFANKITVRLPYDKTKLPEGMAETEIRTFYFDTQRGSWVALEHVSVDTAKAEVVSLTDHFTDMVNGVVAVPEHPETASFNPTQIKDLKAADPGAKVNLIEAPSANAMGDVRLSYPIELPPGRTGHAPQLGLSYNSSSGNGWVGMGWSLSQSMLMVDTRWGVPRYDGTNETETYILDGEQLAPVAHRGALVPRAAEKSFRARVEGGFRRMTRHGNSPSTYWWEIREKDGTAYFYGGDPTTNAPVADSTLSDAAGNVYMWALREVRDTNGNTIHYRHQRVSDTGIGNNTGTVAGSELYLRTIDYTGDEAGQGAYKVTFLRDSELPQYTRRPDVMIDARGGFKKVTAELLGRVEVTFNNGSAVVPVRSYDLTYITGAFDKKLLSTVIQNDAAGAEFNRHTFTYFDEVRETPTKYKGFGSQRANWNTGGDGIAGRGLFGSSGLAASALSGHDGGSFGGHLYVGVTYPFGDKSFSIGGKWGTDSSDTSGLLALIDINGDNLPDKVFREGDGDISYRRNMSGPNAGSTMEFGGKRTVGNLSVFSAESTAMVSRGPEAYAGFRLGQVNIGGFVGFNRSTTDSESPIYFMDVNGDGLVDIVNGRRVLFNRLDAQGDPDFTEDSSLTPYPIGDGTVTGGVITTELQEILARQALDFPKVDTVRRWIAPFDGTVAVTAPVALTEDVNADRYDTEDGVRVAIQKNGTELWSTLIGPTDFATKTPTGVNAVPVVKGDVIYFRVQSVNDGAFDHVAWAPKIQYVAPAAVDSDGLNPWSFDIAQDFTLISSRRAVLTAPLNGTASVVGAIVKSAPTSDDAVLELYVNGNRVAFRNIPAAEMDSYTFSGLAGAQDIVLKRNEFNQETGDQTQDGDEIEVRLNIASRVDLTKFAWSADTPPALVYSASPDLPADSLPTTVPLIGSADAYPESDLAAPLAAWVAPSTGTFNFEAEVTGGTGVFTLTAKKPLALLAKTDVTADAPSPTAFSFSATEGDTVFFEFHGANAAAQAVTAHNVRLVSGGVPREPPLPSALYFVSADDILPQHHRGWNAFGYDGNLANGEQPIALAPADLTLSNLPDIDDQDDVRDLKTELEDLVRNDDEAGAMAKAQQFGVKVIPYMPKYETARFEGPDAHTFDPEQGPVVELYASATEMSSSRRGKNFLADPGVDRFAGARGVPRISVNSQRGRAGGANLGIAGLGGVSGSVSVSEATSRAILDFKDLNGDQFPDVVASGLAVQYSPARGGLETEVEGNLGASGHAQQTMSETGSKGLGGTFAHAETNARADGDARAVNPPVRGGDAGLQMPSLGITANFSNGSSDVNYDLIDINGDGLPDRLSAAGGTLRVQLNLGYKFAAEEDWDSGDVNAGVNSGDTFGGSIGFNDGIYGFGGGINTSGHLSNGKFSLIDMNGDGLLDRVRLPGLDSDKLLVAVNDGNGFMAELDWGGIDGRAFARSVTETHGAGLYVTFTLGIVVINPGISFDRTVSRAETAIQDIDGDGYPDHLTSSGDSAISAGRNPTDRTNLLKGVTRPLGASFEVSYDRAGNTFPMQPSRWVMSRLVMNDGQPGDGEDRMIRAYAWIDGVHERREREFYGFRQCVETHIDPALVSDLSQPIPDAARYRVVTRTYLNDTYYLKGLMSREELATATGEKYTQVDNTYVVRNEQTQTPITDPGALRDFTGAAFPSMARADKRWFERLAAPGKSTFEQFTYDIHGNVLTYLDAGDEENGDEMTASIAYHEDLPPYIVGKANLIVVNGDGRELRRRAATFELGTGNLLEVRKTLADATTAVTTMTYDGFGNLSTITGPTNHAGQRHSMRYTYDPVVSTHVASVTDLSFGYVSTAEYDLRWGQMSLSTDINGQRITTTYDDKGRMADLTGPYQQGSGGKTITMAYNPDITPTSPVPWALTRHFDIDRSPTDFIETATFIDGMKRVTQTKKDLQLHTSGDSSTPVMMVSGRVRYDGFGRAVEQFYPTTEPLGTQGTFNPAYDPVQPTRTTYDVPDRAESVANPANEQTRFVYDFGPDRDGRPAFRTTVTDPNGIRREVYRDVDDDIRTVNLFNTGGVVQRTSYGYNAIDEITAVRDDRNNVTTAAYDNFGRRVQIVSPDMGRTDYVFDLASNLRNKITANLRAASSQITYTYDFNRLASITYPQFPANNVTYTYGPPAAPENGANRVTRMTAESGLTERGYGPLGEMVREKKTVATDAGPDPVYETTWRFDTWNRLQSMRYPDSEVLDLDYDSGGLVSRITGTKTNDSYTYLSFMGYDKFEARERVVQGNGSTSDYAYNPLHRRLANLLVKTAAGRVLMDVSYGYDQVGNILSMANAAPLPPSPLKGGPTAYTFGYDDLYQLTTATGMFTAPPPGGSGTGKVDKFTLSMSYDTIHNITRKNQRAFEQKPQGAQLVDQKITYDWSYDYGSPRPHAATHIGDRTFLYDLNGNQVGWDHDRNGTRRRAVFDEDNRIQSITDGPTSEYKYDDDTTRVVKRRPGGEVIYVNQWYVDNAGKNSKHVFAGTTRIATKLEMPPKSQPPSQQPPGPGTGTTEKFQYFYHPDHLGSASYVTDQSGEVYQHLEYFPFGETWVDESPGNSADRTPYRFTGKEFDEETGLYYFGARYYDPRTSLWTTADPALGAYLNSTKTTFINPSVAMDWRADLAGSGMGGAFQPKNINLYAYTHQNPVKFTDPDGRFSTGCGSPASCTINAVIGLYLILTAPSEPAPQPQPQPGPAPKAENDNTRSNYIHRGLTARDVSNLKATGMVLPGKEGGKISPDQHILGAPSMRGESPFISATRDPKVAEDYAQIGVDPGYEVITIDPAKLPGAVIDAATSAQVKDPVARDLAKRDQELLIVGPIPESAIVERKPVSGDQN